MDRWTADDVLALAPDEAVAAAARATAVPGRWSALGSGGGLVWGRYHTPRSEPYDVVVDPAGPAARCTCPSRKAPCKHAVALLLLWVAEQVPPLDPPADVLARRPAPPPGPAPADPQVVADRGGRPTVAAAPPARPARTDAADRRRQAREERVRAGLDDLDRWLADQVRHGLAAPQLLRTATWEQVAARLVDAQAGSLANRVRRVSARVGVGEHWHGRLLEELALLHVLAVAGRRTGGLPPGLAASVRQAVGWSVAQADVRAEVPVTDRWHVAGRSVTDEDRFLVQRTWLWGAATRVWALVLQVSVSEYGFGPAPWVGATMVADLHFYPGALRLRAVVGEEHEPPQRDAASPAAGTVADAVAAYGEAVAVEPWLDRWPACVAVRVAPDGDGWVVADHTGAVPLNGAAPAVPTLAAVTARGPVPVTGELSADGFRPLSIHLDGRTVPL